MDLSHSFVAREIPMHRAWGFSESGEAANRFRTGEVTGDDPLVKASASSGSTGSPGLATSGTDDAPLPKAKQKIRKITCPTTRYAPLQARRCLARVRSWLYFKEKAHRPMNDGSQERTIHFAASVRSCA